MSMNSALRQYCLSKRRLYGRHFLLGMREKMSKALAKCYADRLQMNLVFFYPHQVMELSFRATRYLHTEWCKSLPKESDG